MKSKIYQKICLVFAVCLMAFPVIVFAGNNSMVSASALKLITGAFGVSLFGAIGLIVLLRKAIKEITEAILIVKERVTDKVVLTEIDQALEAIADVLAKIKMDKIADKIRKVL